VVAEPQTEPLVTVVSVAVVVGQRILEPLGLVAVPHSTLEAMEEAEQATTEVMVGITLEAGEVVLVVK
jgi:hypothetical protein